MTSRPRSLEVEVRNPGVRYITSSSVTDLRGAVDAAPLDRVVIYALPRALEVATELSQPSIFRPGYDEGLLATIGRVAEAILDDRIGKFADLVKWATQVLDAIQRRDQSIPELPNEGAPPSLETLLRYLDEQRHLSPSTGHSSERPTMDSRSKPTCRKQLKLGWQSIELLEKLSKSRIPSVMPSLQKLRSKIWKCTGTSSELDWSSLRCLATYHFPMHALMRAMVCDIGDADHGFDDRRFETAVGSVVECLPLNPYTNKTMNWTTDAYQVSRASQSGQACAGCIVAHSLSQATLDICIATFL